MNIFAISADETALKLRTMLIGKDVVYSEIPFGEDCIENNTLNYEKIFSKTLPTLLAKNNIYPATLVYVIPDTQVAYNFVEIPAFTGKKLIETLNLELSMRYTNGEQFKKAFTTMGEKNSKAAFFAYLIRKNTLNAIHSALKQYKFSSRYITFGSAMKACALFETGCIKRRDDILFADVKESSTKITVVKDLKLAGMTEIPYGEDLLSAENKLITAPPVVRIAAMQERSAVELCETESEDAEKVADVKAANLGYFMRTLEEMCKILTDKYRLENIMIKINVKRSLAELFLGMNTKDFHFAEPVFIKTPIISANLDLYGAVNPKLYNKGLIF